MSDVASVDGSQPGPVDPRQVAAALASALDADDFESVVALMDDDVVYRIGDDEHRGPDSVVESYRVGSALARRLFEVVEYSHEIVGLLGERTVRIDFADALYADGERHDHHSVQDVEVGGDGLIVSITDQPVEGQRERDDAFMARHGLTRDH